MGVDERLDERNLSMAGKEVLIKALLQAIPTYVMSCFFLSASIIQELEQIIRRYWWGSPDSKGISWIVWRNLCCPKRAGGLGFRDLESFNLSLLTKQAWRLETQPQLLLSQVLKAKYFPNSSLFSADLGDKPSATWRSNIYPARSFLIGGLCRRIGDGRSTSIWGDAWLLSEGLGRIITCRPISTTFSDRVSDLINQENGGWNLDLIDQFFWTVDKERIL